MAIGGVEITAFGTILVLFVWYLKDQTKQNAKRESDSYIERAKRQEKHDSIQAEDRRFNRDLITGTLKEIHATGIKNSELNRKSISMQKEYSKESIKTLKNISDRLNGGTEGTKAIASLKAIDERRREIKVKVERRK